MADDQSYMSFLEKANAPLTGYSNASSANSPDKKKLKAMDAGAKVPEVIMTVIDDENMVYVTDADEPFDGVNLGWEHSDSPTGESFAALIDHPTPLSAGITTMKVEEWDKTGEYTKIADAVKEAAGREEPKVYVVPRTEVKTEYWVVALDKKEKRLVGVKTLGVES